MRQTYQPAYDEPEGQLILGRYRVLGEAGAGGFGTVHIAWDGRMQRRVAVKAIDLSELAGEGPVINAVEQLPDYALSGLDEARTAAMLNHANIVTVHDFEVRDNVAYLIMEYVDGMTLAEVMRVAGDNMTVDMVTAVFDGVAAALEFAHENQVLHLDIKPDNVMIDHQGQVKVMDFGLARLSGAQGYASAAGGTIGYMPPEQMMRESLDVRCDEWALASLTYEMISGANPFLARDLSAAIDCIENAEIVLPSLCLEGLSPGIDDVMFFALDPDRFERYATVEDFAEEMDRFLGSAPAGRKQLATLVRSALDDEASGAEFAGRRRLPRMARLARHAPGIALRAAAAAGVGVLAYAGLMAIPPLGGAQNPLCWGTAVAAAAVATASPRHGSILGVAAVAAALAFGQAYAPAIVLAVAGLAWWAGAGITDNLCAVGGLAGAAAGAVGMGPFGPVLCAFLLPARRAVASTVLSVLLLAMLGACGSQSLVGWNLPIGVVDAAVLQRNLLVLVASPGAWMAAASWLLAAGAGGALCRRHTVAREVAGVAVAGLVLVAGAFAVGWVDSGFASWTSPALAYLIPSVIATVAGMLIVFLAHRLIEDGRIVRGFQD